jgi:hypothetical protein
MSTTLLCPNGHASVESDFCSECGAKIQNALQALKDCPDCSAPAPAAGINFCEICGYNFATRVSGVVPIVEQPAAPKTFQLTIAVDASLRDATSPEAPKDAPVLTYNVDKAANLIGRTSEARAIFPDIALDRDAAVSHRHGMISRTQDGMLFFRDLSSSNGTRLNGKDLAPLVDTPLKNGDELTLGHWTRITVEAI